MNHRKCTYANLPMTNYLHLYKGTLDIQSDLNGVCYINIDNGINAAGEEIRKELESIF